MRRVFLSLSFSLLWAGCTGIGGDPCDVVEFVPDEVHGGNAVYDLLVPQSGDPLGLLSVTNDRPPPGGWQCSSEYWVWDVEEIPTEFAIKYKTSISNEDAPCCPSDDLGCVEGASVCESGELQAHRAFDLEVKCELAPDYFESAGVLSVTNEGAAAPVLYARPDAARVFEWFVPDGEQFTLIDADLEFRLEPLPTEAARVNPLFDRPCPLE